MTADRRLLAVRFPSKGGTASTLSGWEAAAVVSERGTREGKKAKGE